MNQDRIFALTPQGEAQLRGAGTTVTSAELDLLVRVDGVLTVAQIKAGLPGSAAKAADALFERLLQLGLLRLSPGDPFADQFRFDPTPKALELARAEGDAASASLRKAGYFVRIAKRAAKRAAPGQALTAVVVEDDPKLASFLQAYMSFEGFQVRTAGNRAEVIDALRALPVPDLVLLDVMLPDADGFDILHKIRRHAELSQVPVIMLTGKATRENVIRGLAGGADGYITKPFEADALVEAVRTVLGTGG